MKAFDWVDYNKLWNILQEMGIPDHLPDSWETFIQVKKQQLEPYMEQLTGKGVQNWEKSMSRLYTATLFI